MILWNPIDDAQFHAVLFFFVEGCLWLMVKQKCVIWTSIGGGFKQFWNFHPLICEEVHLIGGLGGVIFLKDIFSHTIFTPSKIRANKFDFIPTLRGCDSPPSFCINIMKLGNPLKIAPLCIVLFFLRPENGAVSFLERFCFLNDDTSKIGFFSFFFA